MSEPKKELKKTPRTREREATGFASLGQGVTPSGNPGTVYWCTEPFREYCKDETHGRGPYKHGGPLVIKRAELIRGYTRSVSLQGPLQSSYSGRFTNSYSYFPYNLGLGNVNLDLPDAALQSEMEGWGAKGWSKFKPGKPGVNIGQALAELSQFPTVPGRLILRNFVQKQQHRYRRLLKDSGSEYLGYQFAWNPMLGDLADLYKTVQDVDRRLSQLKRDNGRGIRRKGTISSLKNMGYYNKTEPFSGQYPILTSSYYSGPRGSQTATSVTSTDVTFAARFRYYIPDIDKPQWPKRAVREMFGLNLDTNLSLIWELTPWSWLIDYFTSVGDILDNLTNSVDNLTADYAYVMRHWKYEHSVSASRAYAEVGSLSCTTTLKREVKQRWPATAYGFGLTYDGLSSKRMLILAALGFSRLKF